LSLPSNSINEAYLSQYVDLWLFPLILYRVSLLLLLLFQMDKKIGHWDVVIRDITALALHNITSICPRKMAENMLPQLIKAAESNADLFLRHGAIVAVGHMVSGLSKAAKEEGILFKKYLGKTNVPLLRE